MINLKKAVKTACICPIWGYFVAVGVMISPCYADTGTASWYNRASCLREGTSGIMANGKELDDEKLTCASWDYPFGTKLKVTRTDKAHGQSVVVVVTDRGPAKRLYRLGRIIDLSERAMRELDGIERGIIKVSVTRI